MSSVLVDVEGRRLKLTNLEKVLYPETGTTKAEVIDYYTRVAPVLLPHLADRPITLRRYPDGVAAQGRQGPFYDKDASRHAPDWLRTARLPVPGSTKGHETIGFGVLDDLPSLVWAANLAGLELHVPQWTVDSDGVAQPPDLVVFDLDPGAPATVVECCRVASEVRDVLAEDGLVCVAKTSGSKGMQVSAAIRTDDPLRPSAYARSVADVLAARRPDGVVSRMAKVARPGKVFVDWSQNNPAKTTVAPYSLRGRDAPTASTPVTWDEVAACRAPEDLVFRGPEVLDRVAEQGDLWASVLRGPADRPELPAATSAPG